MTLESDLIIPKYICMYINCEIFNILIDKDPTKIKISIKTLRFLVEIESLLSNQLFNYDG